MKQKQTAFSIIELLVVIVIIGILATVSIPMFSGYLAKSKDTERQVFVRELHRLLLRNTVGQSSIDYRLGETTATAIQERIKTDLTKIGYSSQDINPKEGIAYFYFLKTSDITTNAADEFFVFACRQDALGATSGTVQEVAFVAGTIVPGSGGASIGITDANARAVCGDTPLMIDNATHVEAGWTAVEVVG